MFQHMKQCVMGPGSHVVACLFVPELTSVIESSSTSEHVFQHMKQCVMGPGSHVVACLFVPELTSVIESSSTSGMCFNT